MEFKKEMDFDVDSFNNQKFLTSTESIGSILLNLFFSKPGSFPNMPNIGIDIAQYVYSLSSDIDTDLIKDRIFNQCSELLPYIMMGNVQVFITNMQGNSVLMVSVSLSYDDSKDTLLYAFGKQDSGAIVHSYENITHYFK